VNRDALKCLFVFACLEFACLAARADVWVTGYYPGYRTGVMAPSNIDFTVITHVIHFSLIPNSDGTVNSNDNSLSASACTNLVQLAHAAGRKALICVGGAGTEPDFLAATTAANLSKFVSSISNFVAAYSYDGVDIDWEPFNSADTNQYTNFVVAMRAALGTNRLLTVAAPAYPEYGDSPTAEFAMLAAVQNEFDQINAMTYDLSGAYEGWVTWYNSPIYDGGYTFPGTSELVTSINGTVSNFVGNGVSPSKLGVATAFYGDIWTGGPGVTGPRQSWPSTNAPVVSSYTYQQLVAGYYQSNLYHWDSVAQAAYLGITNVPGSNDMFISYDDAHATEAKVSYARNMRLGGIMIWELSQDYNSAAPAGQRMPLSSALKQVLATPNITSFQWNGTNFGLTFSTAPLGLYSVQWSSNLNNPVWNILTNNVAGTGTNISITDPTPATNSARYYRIQTPP